MDINIVCFQSRYPNPLLEKQFIPSSPTHILYLTLEAEMSTQAAWRAATLLLTKLIINKRMYLPPLLKFTALTSHKAVNVIHIPIGASNDKWPITLQFQDTIRIFLLGLYLIMYLNYVIWMPYVYSENDK